MADLDEASLNSLTLSACQVLQQTYGLEIYVVLVNLVDEEVRQAATQCTGHADRVLTTETIDMTRLFYRMMESFLSVRPVAPKSITTRLQFWARPSEAPKA